MPIATATLSANWESASKRIDSGDTIQTMEAHTARPHSGGKLRARSEETLRLELLTMDAEVASVVFRRQSMSVDHFTSVQFACGSKAA
jgi:hypothetical protein